MSETILRQTIIMLILIMVGVLSSKIRLISKDTNKELSGFLLQVVNPVVIFMSYQTEYRSGLAENLILTFAFSVAVLVVEIIAAYLLIRNKQGRETQIERFSAIYSNCGFMGIPLINALFGMEGVFYLTAFITVFNIFVWTHGIILISGERDMKKVVKVFYSPTMIAIFVGLVTFFLRLRLPSVPARALGYISDLNTPVAMIVSGVTIADTNIVKLLKKPSLYYVTAVRLLILPVIVAGLLSFMPIDEKVRVTITVAASAPPAAMCTLQCVRYGKNSLYSSEIFAFGTVLSAATLPLIVRISEIVN